MLIKKMCSIYVHKAFDDIHYNIEVKGLEGQSVKFAVGEKGTNLTWYDAVRSGRQYYTLNYLPQGNRGTTYTVHVYCDNEYVDEYDFYVSPRH